MGRGDMSGRWVGHGWKSGYEPRVFGCGPSEPRDGVAHEQNIYRNCSARLFTYLFIDLFQ